MLIAILQHTPGWVWLLLAALVAYGLAQSTPKQVSTARAMAAPLVMAVLSWSGLAAAFPHQPLALAAWGASAAAALGLARRLGLWRGMRRAPSARHLLLPGSWLPLALILSLFAIRFAAGVALARDPALALRTDLGIVFAFAYGGVSGIFLARGLQAWRLTRSALPQGLPG